MSLQPGDSPSLSKGLLDKEGSRGGEGERLYPQVWGALPNYQMDQWWGQLWPRQGRCTSGHHPVSLMTFTVSQKSVGAAPGRVSGDRGRSWAQRRFSRVGVGGSVE